MPKKRYPGIEEAEQKTEEDIDMKLDYNLISGTMFGVAVGDALGAPLEFMSAGAIKQFHGTVRDMIGGGWLNVRPGEVTDDTQMTLAVAHGICSNPENVVPEVGRRFIEWANNGPKDIGATCAHSIHGATRRSVDKRFPSAENWFAASHETHLTMSGRSGGNGALMRTAYVGLYYHAPDRAADEAIRIARMTHWDGEAAEDCAAYSRAICCMVQEEYMENRAAAIVREICESVLTNGRYKQSELMRDRYKPTPSGYGVDSLKAALHCIFTTFSFEEAVIKAVNLGGDADTIGAITGGLAGALYGYEAIPNRWVASLDGDIYSEINSLCRYAQQKGVIQG